MKTDTEIRAEGFNALIHALGEVEAERFIVLSTVKISTTPNGVRHSGLMKRSLHSLTKREHYEKAG